MTERFPSVARRTPLSGARRERSDLFHELGEVASRTRIERVLREFGRLVGDDRSTTRLREAAGDELDLEVAAHRVALLAWLRAWGCRHLRVADTRRSSTALASWWRAHRHRLPPHDRALTDLAPAELAEAAGAFGALATSPAAWRAAGSSAEGPAGRWSVSIGETAAAKALFAIRPQAFPPWDAPIRDVLGLAAGAGLSATPAERYGAYLSNTATALRRLAERLHTDVASVPARLGRPTSTPPRLVDEYLWMRVNRR
jgi:hypothetical protein